MGDNFFKESVLPNKEKVTLLQEQVASYLNSSTEKIYNLDINNDSLFMVTRFSSPIFDTESVEDLKDNALPSCFMLQKYNFTDPSLSFNISPETNISFLKSVGKVNEVSLTFIDNSIQDFQRYHYEWISHWYDRLNDRMVNGIRGKFRNLEIVRFKFIQPSSVLTLQDNIELKDNIQIVSFLNITGLCPTNIILPKGDSSGINNIPVNTYKYKVQSASISYMPLKDEKTLYGEDDKIYNPLIETYFF